MGGLLQRPVPSVSASESIKIAVVSSIFDPTSYQTQKVHWEKDCIPRSFKFH